VVRYVEREMVYVTVARLRVERPGATARGVTPAIAGVSGSEVALTRLNVRVRACEGLRVYGAQTCVSCFVRRSTLADDGA